MGGPCKAAKAGESNAKARGSQDARQKNLCDFVPLRLCVKFGGPGKDSSFIKLPIASTIVI
jgi:hypothetical protein